LAPIVGIATIGFYHLGGILQLFVNTISKFCGCQQQHQADCI
jgi:hypothetical protein